MTQTNDHVLVNPVTQPIIAPFDGASKQALLEAPDQPGAYELRYHLGSDGSVLARHPITVTE